jgi:hypothetical protein
MDSRYDLPCSQLIMSVWSCNKPFTIVSLSASISHTSTVSAWGQDMKINQEQKWLQSTDNMQNDTGRLEGIGRCIRVRQFSRCPSPFLCLTRSIDSLHAIIFSLHPREKVRSDWCFDAHFQYVSLCLIMPLPSQRIWQPPYQINSFFPSYPQGKHAQDWLFASPYESLAKARHIKVLKTYLTRGSASLPVRMDNTIKFAITPVFSGSFSIACFRAASASS